MTRQVNQSIALSAFICTFLYLLAMPAAGADELVAFDPNQNEFPESVSANVSGYVYVTDLILGAVWRMSPEGKEGYSV